MSIIKPKPIKHDNNGRDFNHNNINGSKSEQNGEKMNGNNSSSSRSEWTRNNSDSVTRKADLELEMIIDRFGGESMNQPSMSGHFYSGGPIRPGSSQSQSYGYARNIPSRNNNPSGSGAGGSGGGNNPSGGDGGSSTGIDSNRQIILILLRLQQDTNNVLNRLSYLENTVASIQVIFFFIESFENFFSLLLILISINKRIIYK